VSSEDEILYLEDIKYCPVFKPTIEEFEKGFVHYLNKVE
jgi:hypothetical protein